MCFLDLTVPSICGMVPGRYLLIFAITIHEPVFKQQV
jgi:hypothetical protein